MRASYSAVSLRGLDGTDARCSAWRSGSPPRATAPLTHGMRTRRDARCRERCVGLPQRGAEERRAQCAAATEEAHQSRVGPRNQGGSLCLLCACRTVPVCTQCVRALSAAHLQQLWSSLINAARIRIQLQLQQRASRATNGPRATSKLRWDTMGIHGFADAFPGGALARLAMP